MPTLEDYENLGPFSPDELVEAVNAIIKPSTRLPEFTRRTLRYYVSEGIIPPPEGPPKYSRYSFEHLKRIVEAKLRQDKGERLESIRWRGTRNLYQSPLQVAKAPWNREPEREYRLTLHSRLLIDQSADPKKELLASLEKIAKILRDST